MYKNKKVSPCKIPPTHTHIHNRRRGKTTSERGGERREKASAIMGGSEKARTNTAVTLGRQQRKVSITRKRGASERKGHT